MPRISSRCLGEIKSKVSLYDVVSSYVSLKKSGSSWKGLSPFSPEKTPSFYVHPDKELFYCFSTGQGGDLFRFIELVENVGFYEAVEFIADRFGIPIEYENANDKITFEVASKKELIGIHEEACSYYQECFRGSDKAANYMQDYWKGRSFSDELAAEHRIGMAPPKEAGLLERLLSRGFSPKGILESGLYFSKGGDSDTRSFFPRFRGRLMIPIHDIQARVVAFTARKTDVTPDDGPSSQAKYINSPESPIFHKSKLLFGLDRARKAIDEDGVFLMVEGQLDVLRCSSSGYQTAVAPQGTSITEEQLLLLKRYSPKSIECVLDGDAAGQKAALRLLSLALPLGLAVTFLEMPEGADPDTILMKPDGREQFEALRQAALSPMAFAIKAFGGEDPTVDKTYLLKRLFPVIAASDSAVTQESYLEEVGGVLKVGQVSLQRDFSAYLQRGAQVEARKSLPEKKVGPGKQEKLTTVEYDLLFVILHYEALRDSISQLINVEWIKSNNIHGVLLKRIIVEIQEGLWQGADDLHELLEEEEERNEVFSILALDTKIEEPVKVANEALKAIYINYLQDKEKVLKSEMEVAFQDNPATIPELKKEREDIRLMMKSFPTLKTL